MKVNRHAKIIELINKHQIETQEELAEKRHNYELAPCGETVLCVDYKMSGVGSNSCGPELPKKFRVQEKSIAFAFHLHPLKDKGSPGGMEGV